jgi:UDP-N-acetylmuramate: L-alanyl-gamma-D-glutamyl-meso-diaminopimelate ligase
MHIHILGICGTFMGGVAALAREAGHTVTGCDANVYPPMSDQLRALGIELIEGFDPAQVSLKPDLFVIGNVVSRGNPLMEAILDAGLPYTSGPQWLAEHVLQGRHVLAVAGTHGKTTTTSMLAWVLEHAGLASWWAACRRTSASRRAWVKAARLSSRPMNTTPRFSTSAASSCITGPAPRC